MGRKGEELGRMHEGQRVVQSSSGFPFLIFLFGTKLLYVISLGEKGSRDRLRVEITWQQVLSLVID